MSYMRTISVIIKSTPKQWALVFHIIPPYIRHTSVSHRERIKYAENKYVPIHQDITRN